MYWMHGVLATGLLCGSGESARAWGTRGACASNLSQIGEAIASYRSVYGQPPADILDIQGRPLLSWRVQLLPFMDDPYVFKEFHLDEPWDSPHNLPLAAKMPKAASVPPARTEEPVRGLPLTWLSEMPAMNWLTDPYAW